MGSGPRGQPQWHVCGDCGWHSGQFLFGSEVEQLW